MRLHRPGGEAGLHYYRARYYDPKIGRFISEDPSRLKGGINLYSYVSNNPTDFTDPLGRFQLEGFPQDKNNQLYQAILNTLTKLKQKPCCAGDAGDDLITKVENATFSYEPSLKTYRFFGPQVCGAVSFAGWVSGRIQIGSAAFDPFMCGCLEATVIHEATHLRRKLFSSGEVSATENETRCFGSCK